MFKKQPKHDFTSHDADSLRYLSTVYEHITKIKPVEEATDELHEMDILIFDKDDMTEDDEQSLDNAYA